MSTSKKGISIYVTPELYAQIEREAKEEDRSMSKYLERVVTNYMAHGQVRTPKKPPRRK